MIKWTTSDAEYKVGDKVSMQVPLRKWRYWLARLRGKPTVRMNTYECTAVGESAAFVAADIVHHLQYPDDRMQGFVLLNGPDGFFVPNCRGDNPMPMSFAEYRIYWSAWRTLLKRQFGGAFEPWLLKHVIERTVSL